MSEPTRKGQRFSVLALLALALLLADHWVPISPAQAQPKDGDRFGEWGVRCRTTAQTGQVELCTIEHAAYNTKTQKRVVGIRVGYPPQGGAPRAIVVVPLLVILQAGLKMQIDGGEPMVFEFEFCAPDGCQVGIELDSKVLASFKQGSGGQVFFRIPPGRELSVPFSLNGFSAGLAALQ